MDYPEGSLISIQVDPVGTLSHIVRYYSLGYSYDRLPNGTHRSHTYPCPACGSDEAHYCFPRPDGKNASGACLCLTCRLMIQFEYGLDCQACGRALTHTLICSYCGQKWDLNTLTEIYSLHDEGAMIDKNTLKDANK